MAHVKTARRSEISGHALEPGQTVALHGRLRMLEPLEPFGLGPVLWYAQRVD